MHGRASVIATLVLLASPSVYAQPASLDEQRAAARRAAEDGRCDVTISIGTRVGQLDAHYHTSVFMADPVIAACFAMRDATAARGPSAPPPPGLAPATSGPPGLAPVSSGPSDTAGALTPPGMTQSCRERRATELRTAQAIADPKTRGRALLAVPPCAEPLGAALYARDEPVVRTGTPPLDSTRLIGELFAGASLGILAGGLGGGLLGAAIETSRGCSDEFCGLGGAIIGGTIGMTVLAPAGVYLVGTSGNQTGSFGAAFGGAALGTLGGIALLAAGTEELGIAAFLAGPTIGAMIGFNLSRKWEPRGRTQLSWTPTIHATADRSVVGIAGQF